MGKEKMPFCRHQNFILNMLSAPARSYIHVDKHVQTCTKSYFKEIVLKLATNGQSDKGFLSTTTFVPKVLSAPALGLYTCIKALKYIPPVLGFKQALYITVNLFISFCEFTCCAEIASKSTYKNICKQINAECNCQF